MPTKLLSHAARMRRRREKLNPRPSAAKRGYNARWRKLRRMVLARQPVCATRGCHQPSKDVHHKIPKPEGDDSFENLQGLCHECHSRLTAKEKGFGAKG